MSSNPYSVVSYAAPELQRLQSPSTDNSCGTLAGLAVFGGLIAGTATTAANLRQVRAGDLEAGPALMAITSPRPDPHQAAREPTAEPGRHTHTTTHPEFSA